MGMFEEVMQSGLEKKHRNGTCKRLAPDSEILGGQFNASVGKNRVLSLIIVGQTCDDPL